MIILLKLLFIFRLFAIEVKSQTSPISQHGYSSSSDFDWMSLLSEPIHKSLLDSPVNSQSDLHPSHEYKQNKDSYKSTFLSKPIQFKNNENFISRRRRKSEKQKERYKIMSKEEKEDHKRYKREGTRKYRKKLKESIGYANKIDAERNLLLKLIKQGNATNSQKERHDEILFKTRTHRRLLTHNRKTLANTKKEE